MSTDPEESSPENESSWYWLKSRWVRAVLVFILLVIVFYVEEDWRGAVAWKRAQQEITAAGETLDPNKFIPPPVPDDQNFALLPIFEMAPDGSIPSYLAPVGMDRAFSNFNSLRIPITKSTTGWTSTTLGKGGTISKDLPFPGNWLTGEKPDLPALQKGLLDLYNTSFPKIPAPANATPLDLFDLICPALADLRAKNKTLPLCRFDMDYISQPPWNRSLGGVINKIKLAQVLAYEEKLAFLSNRPDIGLDDLEVILKVDSGLRKDPKLVSGLVSIGVVAIELGIVTQGLENHEWNDQQLAKIDADLEEIDDLKQFQFSIRGEVAFYGIPTIEYVRNHRDKFPEAMGGSPYSGSSGSFSFTSLDDWKEGLMVSVQHLLLASVEYFTPNGWIDFFKADSVRYHLLGTVKMADPATRRVFSEKEREGYRILSQQNEFSGWRDFEESIFRPTSSSIHQYAYAQTHIDMARIACRLERYRLVHGNYPAVLKDLIPDYGPLPNDVMSGKPYHYKLLPDFSYLLYSAGWNQLDDGGQIKIDSMGNHYYKDDFDWLWDNHPDLRKKK